MKSLKFNDKRHYILAAVLALFIVMDIQVPNQVANLVDTIVGKIVVIMVGLSLMVINPLVGVLGVIAAYELVRRSSASGDLFGDVSDLIPNEEDKHEEMQVYQNNEITVEEEVIAKMLPMANQVDLSEAEFKPVLGDTHNADKCGISFSITSSIINFSWSVNIVS